MTDSDLYNLEIGSIGQLDEACSHSTFAVIFFLRDLPVGIVVVIAVDVGTFVLWAFVSCLLSLSIVCEAFGSSVAIPWLSIFCTSLTVVMDVIGRSVRSLIFTVVF